jgi:hypothetical protein
MKATNIIFSIALVAVATSAIGQRNLIMEKLFPKRIAEDVQLVSHTPADNNRVEFWIHDLHGKSSKKFSFNIYEAPATSETLLVEEVEIIIDEVLPLENWMTTPFEVDVEEKFPGLESWMTIPFEINDHIELEAWMVKPWI